jgi:hypothetical protein
MAWRRSKLRAPLLEAVAWALQLAPQLALQLAQRLLVAERSEAP